jgi:hypothetical protein
VLDDLVERGDEIVPPLIEKTGRMRVTIDGGVASKTKGAGDFASAHPVEEVALDFVAVPVATDGALARVHAIGARAGGSDRGLAFLSGGFAHDF